MMNDMTQKKHLVLLLSHCTERTLKVDRKYYILVFDFKRNKKKKKKMTLENWDMKNTFFFHFES